MFRVIDRDMSLHIRPLGDEISELLRLDCLAGPKVEGVGAKLDRPFNDAATVFLVVEYITEWVLGDHCYGVGFEVVMELLGCN